MRRGKVAFLKVGGRKRGGGVWKGRLIKEERWELTGKEEKMKEIWK